jgi:dihydroorotate dehydrogenase
VGLSGPGAEALFKARRWQKLTEPFMLSFMSVAEDTSRRLNELKAFCHILRRWQLTFQAPVGLQINFSCPNVGLDTNHLLGEIAINLIEARKILGEKIPLIPKINALVPPLTVRRLQGHCDAVCVSNTLPWGSFGDQIKWNTLFNSSHSPLKHFGGGGLSGAPLLPIVVDWVREAKDIGLDIPINAGGGILRPDDVNKLVSVGLDLRHDSVFIGSAAILRPWRVKRIIGRAKALGSKS